MKVALVIPSIPKYSETFLTNKIEGLKSNGVDVEVMVVGVSEKRNIGVKVHYQPILASKGILRWLHTIYLIITSAFAFPKRSLKLLKVAKKRGYSLFGSLRMIAVLSNFLKLNVNWVHFCYGSMAVERSFIGEVINAKVGISFRGYDVSIYPLAHNEVYKSVWPNISKVHSISKDLYELGLQLGLEKTKPCEIIPPAIETELYPDNSSKNWREMPKFLTVSRLHWKKGIELMLQALAMLDQEFEYTIIGEGEDKERLIYAANQLGIANKVNFIGKKTPEEVRKAMQDNHYYLQYSLQEGFCNAVLEAQASKMFCIVSDAEGLSENVLHEQTGLVVPKGNAQKLSNAIQKALNIEPSTKDLLTKEAVNRVRNQYDVKEQALAFVSFYD